MIQLSVLLMQLPVPGNPATNTSLAAGYLKAYAYANGLLEHARIDMLPRALTDHAGDALLVDAIVARQPDVLGISLYTWNSERSLAVAMRVKEHLPNLIVLAGGPEVQSDNQWVLHHPGLDIAVIGEGEQTFVALLQMLHNHQPLTSIEALHAIPGIAFRDNTGQLVFAPERVALADLSVIPSPYLLGYLEIEPDAMLMVEVSRWCPYSCSFCLYGRNMGTKLGNRYFGLERLLDEIRWGREQGATRVHFIEANLNLVPLFWPLMRALAVLNADGRLALYAELRGEHLSEEVVAALVRAGLRVAEVGLQTANPVALRASLRKTDLGKWAAGTRRLYHHGVEVLLDVILGLPADDAAGVTATLDFITAENLGAYDAFILQVLPGTGVRRQALDYGIRFQELPPYYVLETDHLPYTTLRHLRADLKRNAGLDPQEIEGCPQLHFNALACPSPPAPANGRLSPGNQAFEQVWLAGNPDAPAILGQVTSRLAAHVDIIADWNTLLLLQAALGAAIEANPATLFDLYLLCETAPEPVDLQHLRDSLPYQPGYLDRVAVFWQPTPEPSHARISPRIYLVLPWESQADPDDYAGIAQLIWLYNLEAGQQPPLGAWAAAGGAGVWVRGRQPAEIAEWRIHSGLHLWG